MDVLLNWLAQGAIVAIVTAGILRVIPRARAQARYGVLWTAYILVVSLPIVPSVLSIAVDASAIDLPPAAGAPVMTMPTMWWASPAAALALWGVWAGIQAFRLGASVRAVRRARSRGRHCPASVLARLPHWSRVSATGRRTRVILSDDVRAAAVLGCGTPAIALAPSLLEDLTATDLDRVLVHEWAHVQRRDDLAQFAQRIVHLIVGWHPAGWWLSRQVDFEREVACDEVAVSVTGSAKGYAACLALLAARPAPRLHAASVLAAASPSGLRARIVRILAAPRHARARQWLAITVAGSAGLLACTLVIGHLQVVAAAVTSAVVPAVAQPRPETVFTTIAAQSPSADRLEHRANVTAVQRRASREGGRPAARQSSPSAAAVEPTGEPPVTAMPAPLEATALPTDITVSLTTTAEATPPPSPSLEPRPDERARAIWTQAADLGVEVGRASQTAGTATAGFFRQFGVKLAGAF